MSAHQSQSFQLSSATVSGGHSASAPHVAFAPQTVAKQAGDQWLSTHSGKHCGIARNQINNGEMWMKNPAALPQRNSFHKKANVDQDWYLRHAKRERHRTDIDFPYYNECSLLKKHFNAGAIGKDHSRRVFQELAKMGHSHSEGSILALKNSKALQREMAERYKKVMCTKPKPVGPCPQPAPRPQKLPPMRESSAPPAGEGPPSGVGPSSGSPGGGSPSKQRSGRPSAAVAAQPGAQEATAAANLSRTGQGSLLGAQGGSSLSRCRPSASALSAAAPVRSQASACPPAASHVSPDLSSAVHPSQLSVSDFYSWRPKLIS